MALMQEMDAKVNEYMHPEWADAESVSKFLQDFDTRPKEFMSDMMEVLFRLNAISYLVHPEMIKIGGSALQISEFEFLTGFRCGMLRRIYSLCMPSVRSSC